MKKTCLILFAVLFAGSVFASKVEEKNYNIDYDKLKKGELQVFTEEFKVEGGHKKKRVVGVYLINRPPKDVWNVLKEWDKMGEYVPGLKYYRTIHEIKPVDDANIGESLIEGQLKVPLITVGYTVRVIFNPMENYKVQWALLTDTQIEAFNKQNISVKKHTTGLKNIGGFGYLEPFENGTKTVYTYAPVVEISVPLPAFVERFITKSTLSGYLKAVKERVEGQPKN